jgi:GNAT superfamily N-acetyltransferase
MRRLAASDYRLGALPLQTALLGNAAALQGYHLSAGQFWVARASDKGVAATPSVRIESLEQAEVRALLAALDHEQDRLLSPKQITGRNGAAALRRSAMRLAVVRDAQMRVVGCGALLLQDECAELTQLMVQASRRGQGLGQLLLAKLENEAIRAGRPLLRLQVDVRQRAAQGLGEHNGFKRCGPFAGRRVDHFSVFMEKLLGSA